MITANEGSRHKAYAEYLGVVDYIRKPFAMERLLESVERGLNAAAERSSRLRRRKTSEPPGCCVGSMPGPPHPTLSPSWGEGR